jgi:hypothetical protein
MLNLTMGWAGMLKLLLCLFIFIFWASEWLGTAADSCAHGGLPPVEEFCKSGKYRFTLINYPSSHLALVVQSTLYNVNPRDWIKVNIYRGVNS